MRGIYLTLLENNKNQELFRNAAKKQSRFLSAFGHEKSRDNFESPRVYFGFRVYGGISDEVGFAAGTLRNFAAHDARKSNLYATFFPTAALKE